MTSRNPPNGSAILAVPRLKRLCSAPVIFVRSRPKTSEAYWVAIKDYFADLNIRKTGKVVFDKLRDRFNVNAKPALERLAIPADSGFYLGAQPLRETMYSNLLKLVPFPKKYYVGQTEYRTAAELFAALHELTTGRVSGEWLLHNKTLTSFHDLRTEPWNSLCDVGTVDELDTRDWAKG